MRASAVWLLADPRNAATRTRTRLVAAGTAVAGGLAIAATAVLRVPTVSWDDVAVRPATDPRFSPLVTEAGLKPGVVTGIVLLLVPALTLAWQAVTTGSARRAVRAEALRVAGATPADLRRVGAVDAGVAGLLGGLLAGPVYLVLWLLLGAAAPASARLFPPLAAADLLSWAAVTVLAAAVAAVAGTRAVTPVRGRTLRTRWRLAALALAVVAVGLTLQATSVDRVAQVGLLGGALLLLVCAVLLTGSAWVRWRAQRLARSGRPVDLLAASGLQGLAGPAGRTAGAVFLAGATIGIAAVLTGLFATDPAVGSFAGRVPALLLVCAAALLAVLAAVASMTLAAADDLVTTRRSLASLSALGADPALLDRVQRRRLTAVTVGPMATGTLVGGFVYLGGFGGLVLAALTPAWVVVIAAAVVAPLVWAVCVGIVRVLRPRIREAAAPESLRVA